MHKSIGLKIIRSKKSVSTQYPNLDNSMFPAGYTSKSVYLRTLLYFRAFAGQTLLAVILMTVGVGLNLLKPWPFKYIVDGLLPGDTSHGSVEAKAFVAKWFGWTN